MDNLVKGTKLLGQVKKSVLLCPRRSEEPMSINDSKIGGVGISYAEGLQCCVCEKRLSLFLQIFKRDNLCDFIPDSFDVFEVYRCMNDSCDGIYDESTDVDMIFRFTKNRDKKVLSKMDSAPLDRLIPECKLQPVAIKDYPSYMDYEEDYFEESIHDYRQCENEIYDFVIDSYGPRYGSKIGGYPAWIQNSYKFECKKCGGRKDFIFQLSSEEAIDQHTNHTYKSGWSPHRVMVGDLGNIYAFMCLNCDNQHITTYWDCT